MACTLPLRLVGEQAIARGPGGGLLYCLLLLFLTAVLHATPVQNDQPSQDHVDDLAFHQHNFQDNNKDSDSIRPARSPMKLPSNSQQRSEDSLWTVIQKRLASTISNDADETTQQSKGKLTMKEEVDEATQNDDQYVSHDDDDDDDDDEEEEEISNMKYSDDIWNDDDILNVVERSGGAFWVARGKKTSEEDEDPLDNPEGDEIFFQKREQPFWEAQDKKSINDYVPFYWGSNQNVWGKIPFTRQKPLLIHDQSLTLPETPQSNTYSGWESNQSLWGKRRDSTGEGPFWITRGKRDNTAPFWITRGKKQDGPFWISRGKRTQKDNRYWGANPWLFGKRAADNDFNSLLNSLTPLTPNKRQHKGPFWVTRGKRPDNSQPDDSSPFWPARGKKDDTSHFWVVRGKKDTGVETPFWIARGKKETIDKNPFWIARGKKEDEKNNFWIARGKKENTLKPFWIARGKKEGTKNPFWIARGKKEQEKTPFWIARGKKDAPTNPFWVARGKKDMDEKNGPFWIARGRRTFWTPRGKRPTAEYVNEDKASLMVSLLKTLLENQEDLEADIPDIRAIHKKNSSTPSHSKPSNEDSYQRNFIAIRG